MRRRKKILTTKPCPRSIRMLGIALHNVHRVSCKPMGVLDWIRQVRYLRISRSGDNPAPFLVTIEEMAGRGWGRGLRGLSPPIRIATGS